MKNLIMGTLDGIFTIYILHMLGLNPADGYTIMILTITLTFLFPIFKRSSP